MMPCTFIKKANLNEVPVAEFGCGTHRMDTSVAERCESFEGKMRYFPKATRLFWHGYLYPKNELMPDAETPKSLLFRRSVWNLEEQVQGEQFQGYWRILGR
jgi:hypothetical protein